MAKKKKQKINNNSKKNNKISKNSRVKLNRKNYNKKIIEDTKDNKINIILIIILFISLILNLYMLYHFITFNHHKVEIKTKIKTEYKVPENILFLGDSITEGYDVEEFFKDYKVVNSGKSGNFTTSILDDMNDRVYRYNPSKVFLLIGTNDILKDTKEDEIVENIIKIIELIKENRKETEIYVESIYPINNSDDDKIDHEMVANRTNELIKSINEKLKKYCEKNSITYVNLYDELLNKDKQLDLKYTKDGLHMSKEGYEVITKKIKEYL